MLLRFFSTYELDVFQSTGLNKFRKEKLSESDVVSAIGKTALENLSGMENNQKYFFYEDLYVFRYDKEGITEYGFGYDSDRNVNFNWMQE